MVTSTRMSVIARMPWGPLISDNSTSPVSPGIVAPSLPRNASVPSRIVTLNYPSMSWE